jgi:flagellar biosynthesis/type III secretory pathway protein FliH
LPHQPPPPPPNNQPSVRRPHKLVHLGAPVQLNPSLLGMPASDEERRAQQAFREAQAEAERYLSDTRQQADALLAEAQAQAQALLAEGDAQAQALLAEVEATVAQHTEAGYQAGYQAGDTQARIDCAQALATELATANTLAQAALTFKYQVLQQLSADCVTLMQGVLAHVLGEAWAHQQANVLTLALHQRLDTEADLARLQLVVHPSHVKHLQGQGLVAKLPLQLLGDALVAPTEALVVLIQDDASPPQQHLLFSPTLAHDALQHVTIVTNPQAEATKELSPMPPQGITTVGATHG